MENDIPVSQEVAVPISPKLYILVLLMKEKNTVP